MHFTCLGCKKGLKKWREGLTNWEGALINWMHQLPVHLPNNGKRQGIGDRRGLEEISPKRLLDRHWERGQLFVPIPRDDLLRTACTILVTPLHLGILSPPVGASPFRLFCRSPGTLALPRLGGGGKPGLVVRIYSRSYPSRWNTRLDVIDLESVQVDSRFHNRLFEIGRREVIARTGHTR